MHKESRDNLLDRLDGRNAWQFVGVLYLARWVVLVPVLVLSRFLFADSEIAAASVSEQVTKMNAGVLLLLLVVISPLFETLIECALPYLVVSQVRGYRRNRPKRSWGFVAISACGMALLHPMLAAILPSLITGAFLAYCYAHFAARGAGQAILATAVFHGAINVVGSTMIVMS
ncbi:MAG TPA: hypothetical protein VMY37_26070 [Thermoguttaceae bacterium]|nr:hypothetical protein [Thermoguttaceae bacterium]